MARQYTQMSNGVNSAPQSSMERPRPVVPPARAAVDNAPPQPEKPTEEIKPASSQMISLPFGSIDGERLLLILLIVMLSSEGADFVLIAALIYVMM